MKNISKTHCKRYFAKPCKTLIFAFGLGLCCTALPAFAIGHSTHEFVSKQAINYVQDPNLKQLLLEYYPDLMDGSAHPDAGYIGGSQFAETMHWANFHKAYADYIREKCGGNNYYFSAECKSMVAHFMGIVSHSVADNIYDMMFHNSKVYYYDKPIEENSVLSPDSAVDFMLYDAYSINIVPPPRIPLGSQSTVINATSSIPFLGDLAKTLFSSLRQSTISHANNLQEVFRRMGYNGPEYSQAKFESKMILQAVLSRGAREAFACAQNALCGGLAYLGQQIGYGISAIAGESDSWNQYINYGLIANYYWYERYQWLFKQWRKAPGGIEYISPKIAKIMDYYWMKISSVSIPSPSVSFFPEGPGLLQIAKDRHDRYPIYLIFDRPINIDRLDIALYDGNCQRVSVSTDYKGSDNTSFPYIVRITPQVDLSPSSVYSLRIEGTYEDMYYALQYLPRMERMAITGYGYNVTLWSAKKRRFLRTEEAGGWSRFNGATAPNNQPARLIADVEKIDTDENLNISRTYDNQFPFFIRSLGGQVLRQLPNGDLIFADSEREGTGFNIRTLDTGVSAENRIYYLDCQSGGRMRVDSNSGLVDCRGSTENKKPSSDEEFKMFPISPPFGGWGGNSFSGGLGANNNTGTNVKPFEKVRLETNGSGDPTKPSFFESQQPVYGSIPISHDLNMGVRVCYGVSNNIYHIKRLELTSYLLDGSQATITAGAPNWSPSEITEDKDTCDQFKVPDAEYDPGMAITGVYGKSGTLLDRLGFVYSTTGSLLSSTPIAKRCPLP